LSNYPVEPHVAAAAWPCTTVKGNVHIWLSFMNILSNTCTQLHVKSLREISNVILYNDFYATVLRRPH